MVQLLNVADLVVLWMCLILRRAEDGVLLQTVVTIYQVIQSNI